MDNYLGQVNDLKRIYHCPVMVAGDIFHRSNSPPELINFAMRRLRDWFTIPGQHDLPFHSMTDIKKSAYWTLVQGGIIYDLTAYTSHSVGNLTVYPFGWSKEVLPTPDLTETIRVALIHKYVWRQDACYPNAPEDSHITAMRRKLEGYRIAIFGDNHKGFLSEQEDGCTICNCGSFILRNSDEYDYRPCVSLIYSDGTVKRKPLDTSKDFSLLVTEKQPEMNAEEFIQLLQEMNTEDLFDFRETLINVISNNQIKKNVRKIIMSILEELS